MGALALNGMREYLTDVKVKELGGEVFIEGYANPSVPDRANEIIYKDAWLLDNYLKNPVLLFNHDRDKPVGKTVQIRADDKGLFIKAKLSRSMTDEITKIRDLVSEQMLQTFSVCFKPIQEETNDQGLLEIMKAELLEISIVTIPMNQDATFSLVSKDLRSKSYETIAKEILTLKGATTALGIRQSIKDSGMTRRDFVAKLSTELKSTRSKAWDILSGNKKNLTLREKNAVAKLIGTDEPLVEDKPEDMPVEEKPADKKGSPSLQSIRISKAVVPSEEDALQLLSDLGYGDLFIEDNEDDWMAVQHPSEKFVGQTAEIQLAEGVTAVLGMMQGAEEVPGEEEIPSEEKLEEGKEDLPVEEEEIGKDTFTEEDLIAWRQAFEEQAQAVEQSPESPAPMWVADVDLWEKGKAASLAALSEISYSFLAWWYIQEGGSIKSAESGDDVQPKSKDVSGPIPEMSITEVESNPYLQQAQQSNVLLGTLVNLMQDMSNKLQVLANAGAEKPSEAVEEVSQPVDDLKPDEEELSSEMMDELQKQLSDLNTKLKALGLK